MGVSLDGVREVHDRYRHSASGEGTYGRILSSIGLLEKYGVPFNILTVVTERTAENIENIYRDYVEKTGLYQNYFCESYRMFFEECLGKMEEVAKTLRD